jgi:hypothetical protein
VRTGCQINASRREADTRYTRSVLGHLNRRCPDMMYMIHDQRALSKRRGLAGQQVLAFPVWGPLVGW